jgi:flagellar hook-length control protein FliK
MQTNPLKMQKELQEAQAQSAKRSKSAALEALDASFASELAGAQAAQAAIVTTNPAALTMSEVKAEVPSDVKIANPDLAKGLIQGTQAQPQSAERSPMTLGSAAGLNTATAIAGLQPWSKDWVFPERGLSSDLKPLIAQAGSEAPELTANAKPAQDRLALAVQQLLRGEARGENVVAQQGAGETAQSSAAAAQKSVSQVDPGMQAIQAQLKELNGQMIGDQSGVMSQNGLVAEEGQLVTKGPVQVRPGVSALSGGEYLSTMQALKAGQNSTQAGSQQQQGKDGSRPSLSVINGGKAPGSKKPGVGSDHFSLHAAGAVVVPSAGQSAQVVTSNPVEVTGHVVKGRMSQDRLSSEALLGVSAGIKNFSAEGGGEMRVRLKPDHLGELHVRIVANGTRVGLQIQASDESARQVIEESIGHLRENLAVQNLSLASVDVTLAHSASSARDSGQQQQQQQGTAQQFQQELLGQNSGQGNNGRTNHGEQGRDDGFAPVRTAPRSSSGFSRTERTSSARAAGRLDVQA